MPVTSVTQDPETLTLTVVADFEAPIHRLWEAYADPRQLEKFWGPPQWPATFTRHDHYPGGRSEYCMTGPDGTRSCGYWEYLAVEEGRSFEVRDGFLDEHGEPSAQMPSMRMLFTFEPTEAGSRLITTTWFNSLAELEQLLEMGMEEGMTAAMRQIDEVLADLTSFASDRAIEAQLLSETQVRISRVIRGTPQQVWDAQQDPVLLRRWLLGPDGWSMTDCQVALVVGETFRYAWAPDDGSSAGFALTGELQAAEPPFRSVATERMEGMEGPATLNEQTLTRVPGGTLLTLIITYPDAQMRDPVLATGMTDGMEASYARLEEKVLAPA